MPSRIRPHVLAKTLNNEFGDRLREVSDFSEYRAKLVTTREHSWMLVDPADYRIQVERRGELFEIITPHPSRNLRTPEVIKLAIEARNFTIELLRRYDIEAFSVKKCGSRSKINSRGRAVRGSSRTIWRGTWCRIPSGEKKAGPNLRSGFTMNGAYSCYGWRAFPY